MTPTGARRRPSPVSAGSSTDTPHSRSVAIEAAVRGCRNRGGLTDTATSTGVPRPIASAVNDSARLSATPSASLFSELKLHGATSTRPSGGRGRIAVSKYDSTRWLPGIAESSRGEMTCAAFGVGIVMTRGTNLSSPSSSSTARGAVAVPVTIRYASSRLMLGAHHAEAIREKIPVGTLWGDNSAGPLRDRGQSRKRSRPPITHRITRLPRRFAPPHLPSGPLWGYSLRPSTASERREADGPAFIASRQPPTGTPLGNQLSQSAAADCRIEGASSGNRTTKRVPPSSGNSAVMCPPCSSTICRLTNSPSPIPLLPGSSCA